MIDRAPAHVCVGRIVRIDTQVGILADTDVEGRRRAERVVERARGGHDRAVLVVSVRVTVPMLHAVIVAVAGEELVTRSRLDDAQRRVGPIELRVGQRV